MLEILTRQVAESKPLSEEQIAEAVRDLVSGAISAEEKAGFLSALAQRGETPEELAGFARELRERCTPAPLDSETRERVIVDVCGTGGDHMNTYNISTAVAILLSAAGVTVAKHGNRAITSRSGSADVLEALGIRIDLSPAEAVLSLRERHFAFLFAPHYHPAFKHIAPARKLCAERGQRTLFNFLGPLLNPVRPTAQLIGVPRPELCQPVARVLESLGATRGMVVSGATGSGKFLDEISTLGRTAVAEFGAGEPCGLSEYYPEHFPIGPARLEDLSGGDRDANAAIIRDLFSGKERGARRDILLVNAGAALLVAGKAESVLEGWEMAQETIETGRAAAKLNELAEPL